MNQVERLSAIPILSPVHRASGIRYFAHRVESNGCYVEKLAITAMPDDTDECPKIIASLTVSVPAWLGDQLTPIEWIEVDPEYRNRGIGREIWRLAERLLNRKHDHSPVTPAGEAFAKAMESNP